VRDLSKTTKRFPLTKGEAYGAETQPLAKELKGLVRQACEELDFLKEEVNGPATNKAWAKAATKASGPESHSQRRRILNKQKDE
jgi:hypothetical protein